MNHMAVAVESKNSSTATFAVVVKVAVEFQNSSRKNLPVEKPGIP